MPFVCNYNKHSEIKGLISPLLLQPSEHSAHLVLPSGLCNSGLCRTKIMEHSVNGGLKYVVFVSYVKVNME